MNSSILFFILLLTSSHHSNAEPNRKKYATKEMAGVLSQKLLEIDRASKRERLLKLNSLRRDLSRQANRGETPTVSNRKFLSRRLIGIYRKTSGKGKEDFKFKGNVVAAIASHGFGDEAIEFIVGVIETESPSLKKQALIHLGHPAGLSGDRLYSKIGEWANRGTIPKFSKAAYLARIGREKAIPDIARIVEETDDKEEFFHAAGAMQEIGSPRDMAKVFQKAKKLKMHHRYKDSSDGLYWIKKKKLVAYVQQAEGEDLKTVLELMGASSGLTPGGIVPVLLEKLSTPDGTIKILIAQRLIQASENPRINHSEVLFSLKEAARTEKTSEIKTELENCINEVEERKGWAEQFQKRETEWIEKNRKR